MTGSNPKSSLSSSLFPAGCRIRDNNQYFLLRGQKSAFSPHRENYTSDQKITFYNGLDVLYHHAKFGAQTTRAGSWFENMVFVCLFVTLQVCRCTVHSKGHTLNKYCVMVYGSILMLFSMFSLEWIVASKGLKTANFRRQVAQQFLRHAVANCENYKFCAEKNVKVCAHHFVQIAERYLKNSTTVLYGRERGCAPI